MAGRPHNRWILPLVLLVITAAVWRLRQRPPQYSSAYIGDNVATLWSTTAAVREPVTTLHYGQQVAVLRRTGDEAEVRADDGSSGWVEARLLMDPALWQQSADLLVRGRAMTAQAVGHTRAVANVHIEPGRDTPRIYQLPRGASLVVLGRKLVMGAAPGEAASDDSTDKDKDKTSDEAPAEQTKQEVWLLVLRTEATSSSAPAAATLVTSEGTGAVATTPIAGWVLAQFVALDPPAPIPDYTDAAGMNVIAWALLDTAPDAGGDKPQYLVATARGGENSDCDFTGVRVYTWGTVRQRYETAYVENDLCGRLPIGVQKTPDGAEFSFPEADDNNTPRLYRMKQTVVRRVTDASLKAKQR